MANGADDLVGALDSFRKNLNELGTQRTIGAANEAVQNIRNSEAKDEDKTNQLRSVAEQLTYSLASRGVPATTLQSLTQYIPKQPTIGNSEQAMILGTPDQQAKGKAFLDDKAQRAMELQQAKLDALTERADAKALAPNPKDGQEFLAASKYLQPDASVRSSLGVASATKQQADKLRALLPDRSDSALNSVPPQFVNEAAQSLAAMVKRGTVTAEEVQQFVPKNVAMDSAKTAAYFSNNPAAANQAGFLKLYLNSADREHATATQQIEDSVMQRAQGTMKTWEKDPQLAKNTIAGLINVKPDDVILDPASRTVTTKQRVLQDKKMDEYIPQVQGLVKQAKGGTPPERDAAKKTLAKLGVNPDDSPKAIKDQIYTNVRQGRW